MPSATLLVAPVEAAAVAVPLHYPPLPLWGGLILFRFLLFPLDLHLPLRDRTRRDPSFLPFPRLPLLSDSTSPGFPSRQRGPISTLRHHFRSKVPSDTWGGGKVMLDVLRLPPCVVGMVDTQTDIQFPHIQSGGVLPMWRTTFSSCL